MAPNGLSNNALNRHGNALREILAMDANAEQN